MAWVRIESSVARHRKFQQAGPAAAWLWICGLAYCQEGLTDGFIPTEALPYLGVKTPTKYVAALVAAGLWHPCDGGWRVHDYLDYNNDASHVRRLQGDRRQAGQAGGVRSGAVRGRPDAKQMLEASASSKREASASSTGFKQVLEAKPKQMLNPDLYRSDLYRSDQNSTEEPRTVPGSAVDDSPPVENLWKTDDKLRMAKAPAEHGNYRIVARVARDVLHRLGALELGDFIDAVKAACAQAHIAYGPPLAEHDVVHKACTSELFKYRHPDLAGRTAT